LKARLTQKSEISALWCCPLYWPEEWFGHHPIARWR